MKTRLQLIPITLCVLLIGFTACEDSATGPKSTFQLETNTAEDIPANPNAERGAPADYTFYDLETGAIVADEDSATTEWDLGFNATLIIVNTGDSGPGEGGALALDVAFEEVNTAPSEGYSEDGIADWYNYTGTEGTPPHTVLPKEDKTFLIKTGDGEHYAKIQILSYYEGNPEITDETPESSRYYTFEYAIQLDGSRQFAEE
ncbi:MAG: HmuY family protein [Balneolaceae bacterium]|nr:HmuY family protein [Balneolaceae bacterium]